MKSNRDVLYTLMDNIFQNLSPSASEEFFPRVTPFLKQGVNYTTLWSQFAIGMLSSTLDNGYVCPGSSTGKIVSTLIDIQTRLARGETVGKTEMIDILGRMQPVVDVITANKDDQVGQSTIALFNAGLVAVLVVVAMNDLNAINMVMSQFFGFFSIRRFDDAEISGATRPTDLEMKQDFYSVLTTLLIDAIINTNDNQPLEAVGTGVDQDEPFGTADETDIPDVLGSIVPDGSTITDRGQLDAIDGQLRAMGVNIPGLESAQAHENMPPALDSALKSLGVDTSEVMGVALIMRGEDQPRTVVGSQELAN